MAGEDSQPRVVGLDIGTSKIAAVIGEVQPDGRLEAIGIGSYNSRGLKNGVVVDIESTVQSIQRAVEQAELIGDCTIDTVYAGIAGSHIRSLNSHGIVAIRDREVTAQDVDRVIDAARALAIPADQKVLHVLPQEYVIDNQEGVKQPIGMSGVRLEAKVHVITCALNAAENIEKCIVRCGLKVRNLILEQLASSYATLSDDERELGVCVIDMGGGTTDVAVFKNGAIRHTAIVPIAGDQITNDIAVVLRTPTKDAEEIKIKYACAVPTLVDSSETVKVPGVGERGTRDLSRQTLAEVVGARYEEIFQLVQAELSRGGFEALIASGIVLTGGSAKMEGVGALAEEVFNMPVRIGVPTAVSGMRDLLRNPVYSTGVGLMMYGNDDREARTATTGRFAGEGLLARIKQRLGDLF